RPEGALDGDATRGALGWCAQVRPDFAERTALGLAAGDEVAHFVAREDVALFAKLTCGFGLFLFVRDFQKFVAAQTEQRDFDALPGAAAREQDRSVAQDPQPQLSVERDEDVFRRC